MYFYIVKFETELSFQAGDCRLSTAQELLRFRSKVPRMEAADPDDELFLDVDRQSELAKAKLCELWSSKGFEVEGVLPSQKFSSLGRKEFFKTGLTASTAKARGRGAYTQIFFEEEIVDPNYIFKKLGHNRAALIEMLTQLKVFYRFWKDQVWQFSSRRLHYDPDSDDFAHLQVVSLTAGFSETLVWENVDQKVSYAIEVFRHLNGLSNRDLAVVNSEVSCFNHAWRWVAQIKQSQYVFIREFLFWPNFQKDHFDDVRQSRNRGLGQPRTKELNFLRQEGFQSKWLPADADDLSHIYELPAEKFSLPGVGSWTDDYAIPYP